MEQIGVSERSASRPGLLRRILKGSGSPSVRQHLHPDHPDVLDIRGTAAPAEPPADVRIERLESGMELLASTLKGVATRLAARIDEVAAAADGLAGRVESIQADQDEPDTMGESVTVGAEPSPSADPVNLAVTPFELEPLDDMPDALTALRRIRFGEDPPD